MNLQDHKKQIEELTLRNYDLSKAAKMIARKSNPCAKCVYSRGVKSCGYPYGEKAQCDVALEPCYEGVLLHFAKKSG